MTNADGVADDTTGAAVGRLADCVWLGRERLKRGYWGGDRCPRQGRFAGCPRTPWWEFPGSRVRNLHLRIHPILGELWRKRMMLFGTVSLVGMPG